MQKAEYISKAADLKKISHGTERIYFGNEFCQYLIPKVDELMDIMDRALSQNFSFTFVTSYVTDEKIIEYLPLLEKISKRNPGGEVVINDWGILQAVKNYDLEPVLGRLLIKQKRDPRIEAYINLLPNNSATELRSLRINDSFINFIKSKGVKRIEIDNLLHGINYTELEKLGVSATIHTPYGYIATGRICKIRNSASNREDFSIGECEGYCNTLDKKVLDSQNQNLNIILKGNTAYFYNDNTAEAFAHKQPDRVLTHLDFPI